MGLFEFMLGSLIMSIKETILIGVCGLILLTAIACIGLLPFIIMLVVLL